MRNTTLGSSRDPKPLFSSHPSIFLGLSQQRTIRHGPNTLRTDCRQGTFRSTLLLLAATGAATQPDKKLRFPSILGFLRLARSLSPISPHSGYCSCALFLSTHCSPNARIAIISKSSRLHGDLQCFLLFAFWWQFFSLASRAPESCVLKILADTLLRKQMRPPPLVKTRTRPLPHNPADVHDSFPSRAAIKTRLRRKDVGLMGLENVY